MQFSGGGNDTSPVVWEVDRLSYVNTVHPLYLTVDVYPTNYEVFANQYATITVNGAVIDSHCSPDESCGDTWYMCVGEYDISHLVEEPLGGSVVIEVSSTGVNSGPCNHNGHPLSTQMFLREVMPTGQPTGIPSSIPSGEPSGMPSGEPTSTPTGQPTGQPTSLPSGQPTGQPTAQPSGQPTGEPTSTPTISSPFFLRSYLSGDDSSPGVWQVDKLGYSNNNNTLYLSVDVMPTNFEHKAFQWATVTVNGEVVVPYCTPGKACSSKWFSCLRNLDVTEYLTPAYGGSVTVEVSTHGVESGPCDYEGCPLYAQVTLTEEIPHDDEPEEILVWIVVGSCVGFCLLVTCIGIAYQRDQTKKKYDVSTQNEEYSDSLPVFTRPKPAAGKKGSTQLKVYPDTEPKNVSPQVDSEMPMQSLAVKSDDGVVFAKESTEPSGLAPTMQLKNYPDTEPKKASLQVDSEMPMQSLAVKSDDGVVFAKESTEPSGLAPMLPFTSNEVSQSDKNDCMLMDVTDGDDI